MRKLNLSHSQQGAVMAEFIVISAMVLLPLFMGLIFIGKYTENKQKVEIASRYSGWERTVWYEKIPKSLRQANPAINTVKDNAQIGYEIENRIFANKNAGIYQKQGENKTHETMDSMTESFWVDNKAGRPSIYAEDKKNKKSFINASLSQAAKGYGFSADGLKNFFSLMSKLGNFDLNLRGAFTSTVNLKLKKPKFLDNVICNSVIQNSIQRK